MSDIVSMVLMAQDPGVPLPATWDGFPASLHGARAAIRRGEPVPQEMLLALDVAHGLLVSEVRYLKAEVERLRAGLLAALPVLAEASHGDVHYGSPCSDDPRDFHPDPECSSEPERAAHRAACDAWERGERPELPPVHEAIKAEGVIGWVTRQPWGLGTTTISDEKAVAAYTAVVSALASRPDGG